MSTLTLEALFAEVADLPEPPSYPRPLGTETLDPLADLLARVAGYSPFVSSVRLSDAMPPGTGLEVASGDFVLAPDLYQALAREVQLRMR